MDACKEGTEPGLTLPAVPGIRRQWLYLLGRCPDEDLPPSCRVSSCCPLSFRTRENEIESIFQHCGTRQREHRSNQNNGTLETTTGFTQQKKDITMSHLIDAGPERVRRAHATSHAKSQPRGASTPGVIGLLCTRRSASTESRSLTWPNLPRRYPIRYLEGRTGQNLSCRSLDSGYTKATENLPVLFYKKCTTKTKLKLRTLTKTCWKEQTRAPSCFALSCRVNASQSSKAPG